MKNTLIILFTLISTVVVGANPPAGTAKSFRDINTSKTPIVTNAEQAVSYLFRPTGTAITTNDYSATGSSITVNCNAMNVLTNSAVQMVELGDINLFSSSNLRSWKMYIGKEYRVLERIKFKVNPPLTINDGTEYSITEFPCVLYVDELLDGKILMRTE